MATSGLLSAPDQKSDPWGWAQYMAKQDPSTYLRSSAAFAPTDIAAYQPQLKAAGLWNPAWDSAASAYDPMTGGAGASMGGQDGQLGVGSTGGATSLDGLNIGALNGYTSKTIRGPGYTQYDALFDPNGNPVGDPNAGESAGSMHRGDYAQIAALLAAAATGGGAAGFLGSSVGAGSGAMGAAVGSGMMGAGVGAIGGGTQGAIKGGLLGAAGGYFGYSDPMNTASNAALSTNPYSNGQLTNADFNNLNAVSSLNDFNPDAMNGFNPSGQLQNVGALDPSGTMPQGNLGLGQQFTTPGQTWDPTLDSNPNVNGSPGWDPSQVPSGGSTTIETTGQRLPSDSGVGAPGTVAGSAAAPDLSGSDAHFGMDPKLSGINDAGMETSTLPQSLIDSLTSATGLTADQLAKLGIGAIGAIAGGTKTSGPTTTQQSKTDPRMDPYIYGDNGILANAQSLYSANKTGINPTMQAGWNAQLGLLQDPNVAAQLSNIRGNGLLSMNRPIAGNPYNSGGQAVLSPRNFGFKAPGG